MLQQLATETGATGWTIASMLFFIGVWCVIAVGVWKARPEQMTEHARLPLSDEGEGEPPADAKPRA